MLEGLFQPTHLIIIFAIALLVFGPKKLPELGKGLGEGIRALKEGMKDSRQRTSIEATKPTIPRKLRAKQRPPCEAAVPLPPVLRSSFGLASPFPCSPSFKR